jgi:rubrerythrin
LLDQGVRAGKAEEYVEFWETGSQAQGAFHCADCGYGVRVQVTLPACPMCGGRAWEPSSTSPFSRSATAPL